MRNVIACMICALFFSCFAMAGDASAQAGPQHYMLHSKEKLPSYHVGHRMTGLAAWYGRNFLGRRTASGARLDGVSMTAAHRTLPLGTKVRVTNLKTGRSVLVTVNDRGPVPRKFCIDLAQGAARKIGLLEKGVARVSVEVVELPSWYRGTAHRPSRKKVPEGHGSTPRRRSR